MLTVYLRKKDIPVHTRFVEINDAFFNASVNLKVLGTVGKAYIERIDESRYLGNGLIKSRFGDEAVSVSNLSTGCKTLLNVITYPNVVFSLLECGWNVVDEIFKLDQGMVYMPYNMIVEIVKPIRLTVKNREYIIEIGQEEMMKKIMEDINNES